MNLIFVWVLLTLPSDRLVCAMWVPSAPTQAIMESAACVWTPDQAASYLLRVVEISSGQVICERPAAELPTLTCDAWPLDHYKLMVYEPDYQYQLCTVLVTHDGPPTTEEIAARESCQKPLPPYEMRMVASGPAEAPQTDPEPYCALPPIDPPASIATHNDYLLLRNKLRWYYGIDQMDLEWQNTYDAAILEASGVTNVPATLLKGLFAQESQFWPIWTVDEVGLGQLTDDGADMALRMSRDLYASTCPKATQRCEIGYEYQPASTKQLMRDILRNNLRTYGTPRQAAEQASGQVLTWARILAAYYCSAADVARWAGQTPSWSYALAAYHSGPACISSGSICPAGLEYIQKVMKQ